MKKRKFAKAFAALALAAALMLGGCADNTQSATSDTSQGSNVSTSASSEDVPTAPEANELTSLEVVRLMGNGINLGNTLEAYNHSGYVSGADPSTMEMGWGQPYTTAEMMVSMKNAGFDTIRIPIAWTNGMNFESGDYTIDERLMARVEQVVNYALDADMYVIINEHWDGGWWGMFGSADEAVREQAMEMYKSMWEQIGERFKDYSYKLIFESGNEEIGDRLNDKEITGSKGVLTQDECYEMAHTINSEFVKLIRAQGGKNADRFLLIAGYNTDITMTCDERYKMPEDTAEDKLLLSVHYYTPWDYCGTDGVNNWGSPSDYEEQNGLFEKLSKFSEQGYGVVIGEYAVMLSNGRIKESAQTFYDNLLDNCDLYDFCPVLWDCSNFYKRSSDTFADEGIAEMFDQRRYANEADLTTEEVKSNAKTKLEATLEASKDSAISDGEIAPDDSKAIAWIMFQSGDWNIAYSVGDNYDPTNKTMGIKATNVEVTGEGTYTVSLDFTGCGTALGTQFAALAISNGETMFPDYTVSIDKILINNAPYELTGKEYTSSDDGKCTRVNLYNQWVTSVPDKARAADGDLTGCSAQIMPLTSNEAVNTLSITFTYNAP